MGSSDCASVPLCLMRFFCCVLFFCACVTNIIFPPATRSLRMTKHFLFSYCLSKNNNNIFIRKNNCVVFLCLFSPPGNSRLSYNCCGILTRHQPLLPGAQCSSINFPSTAGDILTNVLQPQPVELRGPERCRVIYRDLRGMMAGAAG